MSPAARIVGINGIKLCYWQWSGTPGLNLPTLIFAHATGFHARVWDAVIARFPEHPIIALDQRGHGRSEGEPIEHWGTLIADMRGIADHLGLQRAIGVGHSMGAHVLAHTASEMPSAFQQLVLFDPVILAPSFYEAAEPLYTTDTPHPAIRRKRDFASPEAMMERFRARDPYKLFAPQVFEDYCRYGLTEKPDGTGYKLACSPEMEASIYASSRTNAAIHEAVKSLAIPTLVVRAKQTDLMDFKSSPTWPALADQIPQGTDLYRPDRTHFHPFEDPADAARIINDVLAA
ncbi:MAG: alpha/beta hydrolase [Pseudomonadota bacterium]